MNKAAFDLSNLWPDFSLIFNEGINTNSGISTLFVLVLLIFTGVFFCYAIVGYFSANRKTNFYKKLITSTDKNELTQKQRDIRNKAEQHKSYGNLWREKSHRVKEIT